MTAMADRGMRLLDRTEDDSSSELGKEERVD